MEYRIEVRNSSDELIQILENAYGMELTQAVNQPTQLTFSLPATDPKLHFVTKSNELWVREVDGDTILTKTKLLIQGDEH